MRYPAYLFCVLALLGGSVSGQTWKLQTSGIEGSVYPTSVAFGNGRFVMGTQGQLSYPENTIAWSVDGYQWHPAQTFFPGSAVVEFFGGYFYSLQGNAVFRSLDGDKWNFVVSGPPNVSVARLAATSNFIVGSSNNSNFSGVFSSADGFNWSTTLLPQPTGGDHAVSYNITGGANRIWISYDTTFLPPQNGLIATSSDGTNWTNLTSPLGGKSDQRLVYGNGRLIIIDGLNAQISKNLGATFETHSFPYNLVGSINFAGGRFIGSRKLSVSLDGVNWGPASFPEQHISFGDVAYGNGRYVAVGRNDISQESPADWVAVWEAPSPPVITRQPSDRRAGISRSTSFSVTAGYSSSIISYQWLHEGTPIEGATQSSYFIERISDPHAGWYACELTNQEGTILSDPAKLELVPAAKVSRLSNLSVRGPVGTDSATFVSGFVVGGGSGDVRLPLLIRSAGPTLKEFGVSNFLADPSIDVFANHGVKIASNNDWGGDSNLVDEFARLGAFLFNAASSRDAAVILEQTAFGPYSIHTSSHDGAMGTALSEIYDATRTVAAESPRLINLSCRAVAGVGADTLTGGFVISGETFLRVMIRAVGPGLTQFSVPGVLPNPRLTLRRHTENAVVEVDRNDDWSIDSLELQQQVGAFNLPMASKDAVLLAELPPGVYSAQIVGETAQTGIVLLEVYETP